MPKSLPAWTADFDVIKRSLTELGTSRLIHRAHQKRLMGRLVDDGTAVVHRWMEENYADAMLLGLRRVLDQTKGTFSLVKLLQEVESNNSLFTLEEYIRVWKARQGTVDITFARLLYATFSSDGKTLDRSRIQTDIQTLATSAKRVLDYVNTAVAHRAAADPATKADTPISWSDLDVLFDQITGLFNKYYGLVHPGVHVDFAPVLPAGFDLAFDRMLKSTTG